MGISLGDSEVALLYVPASFGKMVQVDNMETNFHTMKCSDSCFTEAFCCTESRQRFQRKVYILYDSSTIRTNLIYEISLRFTKRDVLSN